MDATELKLIVLALLVILAWAVGSAMGHWIVALFAVIPALGLLAWAGAVHSERAKHNPWLQ